jgi:hypothetical protein
MSKFPSTTIEQGVAKLENYNSTKDAEALAEADRKTEGRVSKFIHSSAVGKLLATAGVVSAFGIAAAKAPEAVDFVQSIGDTHVKTTPQTPAEIGTASQIVENMDRKLAEKGVAAQAVEEAAQASAENALIAPVIQVPEDKTGVHVG